MSTETKYEHELLKEWTKEEVARVFKALGREVPPLDNVSSLCRNDPNSYAGA